MNDDDTELVVVHTSSGAEALAKRVELRPFHKLSFCVPVAANVSLVGLQCYLCAA
jgi:hypothetical protein